MIPATIARTAMITSTTVMIVLPDDRPDALAELTCSSLTDVRARSACRCIGPLISDDCRTLLRRGALRCEVLNAPEVNLAPALTASAKKVPYDVLPEPVGLGVEDPAAVPPRNLLDKCGQAFVIDKHKNVKWCPPPGHFVHLGEGQFQSFRRGRPVEPILPVPAQVRGGLAVGDDEHDRVVLGTLVQEAAGQHERMVQVGALHHVPAEPGQVGLPQFPGVVGESDHLDAVL